MDYELEITRLQEMMRMSAGMHSQHSEHMRLMAVRWNALEARAGHMLETFQMENDPLHARKVENERQMAMHNQRMAHVDLRPSEIGDKFDGLIGFVDRNSRGPKTDGPI